MSTHLSTAAIQRGRGRAASEKHDAPSPEEETNARGHSQLPRFELLRVLESTEAEGHQHFMDLKIILCKKTLFWMSCGHNTWSTQNCRCPVCPPLGGKTCQAAAVLPDVKYRTRLDQNMNYAGDLEK